MIGQIDLLNKINNLIKEDRLPRFFILVGQKGSGKKTVSEYIAQQLNAQLCYVGNKAEDIRELIEQSVTNTFKVLYVIPDIDDMTTATQNKLLKLTENPPNLAYICITANNEYNVLPTIKSRGMTLYIENYANSDLMNLYKSLGECTDEELQIVRDICETPLDVQLCKKYNVIDFFDYCKLVVNNINEVSYGNVFKISDKVALKNEVDKYDLKLFWKCFIQICMQKLSSDIAKYANAIQITSNFLHQLQITGVNKSNLFDMWIVKIRENWDNLTDVKEK